MKKAFTLIELLVVIAIIAILAAILFPVFAQAKVAAKGAASTSNAKQIVLASLMYAADYNDQPPVVGVTDAFDAPGWNIKPWSYNMLPYMKTANLFQDPLTTPYKHNQAWSDNDGFSYNTQYAYAWQIHSPGLYYGGPYINWKTISQTELGSPAETVMFFTKRRNDVGSNSWWGSTFGVQLRNTAGVPVCENGAYTHQTPQSLCGPGVTGWGIGGHAGTFTNEEGYNTAGFAYRKAGKGVVGYADGHVNIIGPGQLAAGTNWTPLIEWEDVTQIDLEAYMWDIL
jgi:prepilin-type N-terminal cleavage/methylation domain-containing protein